MHRDRPVSVSIQVFLGVAGQTSSDKLRQTAGGFRPVADLRDGLMREPFNPHCGTQGSYPTGTTPTFRVAGRLNPPPAYPMAKIRFSRKRPMEDSDSSDSGCQIKSELVHLRPEGSNQHSMLFSRGYALEYRSRPPPNLTAIRPGSDTSDRSTIQSEPPIQNFHSACCFAELSRDFCQLALSSSFCHGCLPAAVVEATYCRQR